MRPEEAAAELLRRRMARQGLLAFTRYTFPEYRPAAHHKIIADTLDAVARGEKKRVMIFMPPRHGKPCYNGCMILMQDGSRKSLGEVVVGDHVITHEGRIRPVLAVHDQGLLPVVRIKTELGRETVAALDHPFLTPNGWKNAGDLQPGDVLANVPSPETWATCARTIDEFAMAGYFIGDGHVTDGFCRMTNADPDLVADFSSAMERMGYVAAKMPQAVYGYSFRGISRKHESPLKWVREAGLVGNSRTKKIPDWVFQGSKAKVAAFLGAYFACDGHVNARGKAREDCSLEFYSVNRGLLEGTQHLLLRLGVRSRLATKNGLDQLKRPHKSWRLSITSIDDVIQFRESIRLVGDKARRLAEWPLRRTRFAAKFHSDAIISVDMAGEMPCRCLTVDEDHTFTVDDLVVHNSQLASVRFPAFFLGSNPKRNIIAASYNIDLATDFGREVRELVASQEYQSLFNVTLAQDSKAANRWHTNERGMYAAAGVGTATTGRGAHILLIDDPLKDREQADSEVIREKVWRWYTSTAYTRLESDIDPAEILEDDWLWRDFMNSVERGDAEPFEGSIVLVQTRWHEADLGGRLLAHQDEGGEKWEVLELPAIRTENGEEKALWPAKYPLERLQKIRAVIGPRDWSALYQQAPAPDEGLYFRREWLLPYTTLPKNLRYYGASDYAVTADAGDYTVHVVVGIDSDDNMYVVDLWREQTESNIWVDTFCEMIKRYKPLMWAEESGQILKSLGPFIDRRMRELKAFCAREQFPSGSDKPTRARSFQARMAMGKVFFPKTASWYSALESELLAFDAGKNDDQVDALGLIGRLLDKMAAASKPKAPAKPIDRWEQPEREYASDEWKVA